MPAELMDAVQILIRRMECGCGIVERGMKRDADRLHGKRSAKLRITERGDLFGERNRARLNVRMMRKRKAVNRLSGNNPDCGGEYDAAAAGRAVQTSARSKNFSDCAFYFRLRFRGAAEFQLTEHIGSEVKKDNSLKAADGFREIPFPDWSIIADNRHSLSFSSVSEKK